MARLSLFAVVCGTLVCTLSQSFAADDPMVFPLKNDYVIAEAENLNFSTEYWTSQTSPAGYAGSGWLKNIRGGTGGGADCHQVASSTRCVTAPQGWLKVPVYVGGLSRGEFGGVFTIDVRCYRSQDGDGANDMWAGVEGYTEMRWGYTAYAHRIGRSSRGFGYTWGPLSPETQFNPGYFKMANFAADSVVNFYISPRSASGGSDVIGVDRIIVAYCRYKSASTNPEYNTSTQSYAVTFPTAAWNHATAPTTAVKLSTLQSGTTGALRSSMSGSKLERYRNYKSMQFSNHSEIVTRATTLNGKQIAGSGLQKRLATIPLIHHVK